MRKIKTFIFIFFLGVLVSFGQQKKFITYQVKDGETLESISKGLNISTEKLYQLNPDIEEEVVKGNVIVIPNLDYNKKQDIGNYRADMVGAKDIIVDGFVYHEVAASETLYGITSKFLVSSGDLKNNNPFLLSDGLQVGQTLRIPLPKNEVAVDELNFTPYIVKQKETKYSIAKLYGISIDSLETINPDIKNGLKIDDVIYVPSAKSVEFQGDGFMVHEIQKGETLYSISKLYGVEQQDLFADNPELVNGVNEGMLIKISKRQVRSTKRFDEVIGLDHKLDVALMLPFQSKLDTLDFEKNRLLGATTDFYFGALAAIDSLKNQGLSVNANIYDTEKSSSVSKSISSDNALKQSDVIIGPLYLKNIEAVSKNLVRDSVFIVSPISDKDHSFIKNKNLIQDAPTDDQLSFEMLQFVRENYKNQKLIVVSDNKSEDRLAKILSALKPIDSLNNITILKPTKGYIKPDSYKGAVLPEIENWVLLVGDDAVFVADVIHNLGVLHEDIKLTLFAFDNEKNYEKIENNFLARVRFHYPSTSFVDYNSENFNNFKSAYQKRFFGMPSKYSIVGFDVTYDILMRLSKGDDLSTQGMSERLGARYNYIENTNGNYINQGVYIVSYDGLSLKKMN